MFLVVLVYKKLNEVKGFLGQHQLPWCSLEKMGAQERELVIQGKYSSQIPQKQISWEWQSQFLPYCA